MVPFALVAVLAVSQGSVRCDATRRVVPNDVKRAVNDLRRELGKRGLHVTDLPSDGVAARRLLEAQIKTHAWCGANDQVRIIQGALARSPIDQTLVSAKVARVAGLSGGLAARSHAQVEEVLDVAQRELEKGRLPRANTLANRAMSIVVGSRDPWFLPKPQAQAVVTASAVTEELPEKEVVAGCPGAAKGKPLTAQAAIDHLGAALDAGQIRVTEVRRGPNLLEQLDQAVRLHDNPKTVKTACVLAYRAGHVSDGLDRAMARFQRVNVLRDRKGVAEAEKPQFDALVNEASRQVAVRDYGGARATLETLLVFLGDAERPSGNLPRP
jgi:hypothetical protein